jgi:electron transfer flavoprotein beta subunit
MKIAVVMRQVPDLVEPLEVAESGDQLDEDEVRFVANEADEHALEQAILLKESLGAEVVLVALDYGEVDNTLFAAAARGADRILKISLDDDTAPTPSAATALLCDVLKGVSPDLVLIGCWAHDELQGPLGPRLAHAMDLPFVGVVRGVQIEADGAAARVFKEFPGAARARLRLDLPAVIGIQGAEQPPRYVPVNRIRAAMKSMQFEICEAACEAAAPALAVSRLYPPERGERAEMLTGSADEVASRVVDILLEKGVVK